jgi:16S rRNA (adenine1518-N6/adenine1519-N6)-dimethyltransferase
MRAAKHLGQHFLTSPHVLAKLVAAVGSGVSNLTGHTVLEIGPGTGALTRPLLAAGAHVQVFELDSRCWPVLAVLATEFPGQLKVHEGDALELLPGVVASLKTPYVLTGNLPYNVGTEMVVQALELNHQPLRMPPTRMVFMLQKEVVQRICASPAVPGQWGRLGVLCSLLSTPRKLFDVPPGAFSPPPKVMSSVVELVPMPAPRYAVNREKLDALLRIVFGSRRKMLRSTLKNQVPDSAFTALNIPPTARPENLSLAQLCALAGALT